ncbi:DUF2971 domain-containing protein [Arcobacter sp. LA11]|uniref:DUF2971 domain-containing protein n=1 Tax=Arcobacter sp. LA11 TaxID=1898176 RepID=UPI000933A728|nr:DUF2971 domain-containing protein [Arcobacter sp. LA11]
MAADIKLENIILPKDENARLWRYMDFTKFISMISSKNLFLARADTFEDIFEGSFPEKNLEIRERTDKKLFEYGLPADSFTDTYKELRKWTYINCWHSNQHESAAMWELYTKTNESIAIETSFKKLKEALPNNVTITYVKYIDYNKDVISENFMYTPYIYKRKSFEHEKEVRVITQDINEMLNLKENEKKGINISIQNINDLIDFIHICPKAPEWFIEIVKEISSTYGIDVKKVKKSNLYSDPIY